MAARNKLARLPRDLRQLALGMLLDGATAAEVRDALTAAGCAADKLPGDNAFTAYRQGPEFQAALGDWRKLGQAARTKSLLASALADEGSEDAADVAIFAAIEQGTEFIQTGVDRNGAPVDVGAILRSIVAAKRLALDQRLVQAKARIQELEAQLAAATGAQAAKPGADPAVVQAELDRHLGLRPVVKPVGGAQ